MSQDDVSRFVSNMYSALDSFKKSESEEEEEGCSWGEIAVVELECDSWLTVSDIEYNSDSSTSTCTLTMQSQIDGVIISRIADNLNLCFDNRLVELDEDRNILIVKESSIRLIYPF